MAALTTGADVQHKGNIEKWKLAVKAVGADTFYRGALVYGDAANGKAQAVPAAGDVLLGVCAKTTVATAADQMIEIYAGGLWGFACATTVVEGDVGDVLVMDVGTTTTDNPADLVTGAAATLADDDILFGKILAVDHNDSTRSWAMLTPGYIYDATGVLGWV